MTKLLLLPALLLGLMVYAKQGGPIITAPKPLRTTAAPIETLPAWDKIFTDAAWKRADVKPLSLVAPLAVTFTTPPQKTVARVLWCKDWLLVRVDCEDQSIITLPGTDGANPPRDLFYYKADVVEIFLDPVGDSRMYMEFELSPNNGVFDSIYFVTATPRSRADDFLEPAIIERELFTLKEWNMPGLRTASRIWPAAEGKGWSVIAAFPAGEMLKRLGKTTFAAGMQVHANIVRFDYATAGQHDADITNWSPVLGGCAHVSPAGMGTITLAPQK